MRYRVEKTTVENPLMDSPEWERAAEGRIDRNRWAEYAKAPETTFKMLRCPHGFALYFRTAERGLRAEIKAQKGVSYMENSCEWHGQAPKEDLYLVAVADLKKIEEELK